MSNPSYLWQLGVWLALTACVTPPDKNGGSSGDSGALHLVDIYDCTVDDAFFSGLSVSETPQATVVDVQWSTAEVARGYVLMVEADDADAQQLRSGVTSGGPSTDHDILLRGLHANAEVHFRLVAISGEELICSEEQVFETGGLPAALPTFEREQGGEESLAGYILAPVITADSSFASIFDANGRVVWAFEREDTIWRTHMARDGEGVLINKHATGVNTKGAVSKVFFDGEEVQLAAVRAAHTDFVELPDGAVAVLTWEIREFDVGGETRRILGDTLVEVSPEGVPREIWNVFDHFEVDFSQVYPSSDNVAPDIEDWSHANGFSYDEVNDRFVVSVSGLHTVVGIERVSRTQVFSVGNAGETHAVPDFTVHWPHSATAFGPNGLLIFNRNDYEEQECSEVIVLELDDESGTAEEVMTYGGQDCISVYYLGEAHPLPDGGIQIVWTTGGRIEHIEADGTPRWTLQAALGAGIGFSDFSTSLYPPESLD